MARSHPETWLITENNVRRRLMEDQEQCFWIGYWRQRKAISATKNERCTPRTGLDGVNEDGNLPNGRALQRDLGEAPTGPIRPKSCMLGDVRNVITCAKFQVQILMGYYFTGGRIFDFPIDLCMGLWQSAMRATQSAWISLSHIEEATARYSCIHGYKSLHAPRVEVCLRVWWWRWSSRSYSLG